MAAEPSLVPGVDQLEIWLPSRLAKGDFDFWLQVDGYEANVLRLRIE
jgi:hypothetical protein